MNKKLFLLLGLVVFVTTASAEYDFEGDFQNSVDEAEGLCEGSAENGGDCVLYQSFVNISTQLSATWTSTEVTTYNAFLVEIQTTLASTTYTNVEKYSLVAGIVSQFASANSVLYKKFEFFNLTAVTNVNAIQKVSIYLQQETIQLTITLDSSNNAPLFDSLRAAALATGDSACITAVENLIETELIAICSDTSLTIQEKTEQINLKISELYATYTTFEAELEVTQISGFGFYSQFYESTVVYTQQTQIEVLLTGTSPNIPLLQYLQTAALNYKNSGQTSLYLKMNQFISRINSTFQVTMSWEERQTILINTLQEWLGGNYTFTTLYLYSVECGSIGSLWDICFSIICPLPTVHTFPPVETTVASSTTVLSSTTSDCICTCEEIDDLEDI